MIEKDTALFIQKILETNLPKRAKTIYREPRSIRNIKYFLKDPSHSGIMDKNVFVRGIKVYNSMDEETRTLPHRRLKKKIKKIKFKIK